MDPLTAILAFSLAAALLTLTPGLDTALVLRTAAVEGPRQAMLAGAGISLGSLLWGTAAGLGLGAVLAASTAVYEALRLAGAAYLLWLGLGMLRAARRGGQGAPAARPEGPTRNWLLRGLGTNLLNPKVGVFYVSFLPQFLPAEVPVAAFSALLAGIHATLGLLWFALLVSATASLAGLLRRPAVTRALDGLTGGVLIAFGLRLALAPRGP